MIEKYVAAGETMDERVETPDLLQVDASQIESVDSDAVRVKPWGKMTVLEESAHYRINRIELEPGHHISTQMHYHRSEHWIVVAGTAKVICAGQETLLMPKQSTYVPTCTPHRVENPGVIPLVMIEVQNGEYLGEDDIIRFDEDRQS
jgi:mannose-6-phosphate isomerase-like protein (cupin superfamily)